MPGSVYEGPGGRCFIAERRFSAAHRHGGETLVGFLELADRAIACLARSATVPTLDRREVLFLDTETTGLSGGTGTYVFMVGVGFFDGDGFVVRQYFMRHHAEEPAMLEGLNALFARFGAVVTFNGKAFDVPLLQTRFVAARRRSALRGEPHLDLLFPSRRFWRERLESCSLGSIERSVLGHTRRRDVPSWMIPELYFRYVRGGDPSQMVRVFEHNLHDILSLVALACRLGRLLGDPLGTDLGAEAEDLCAVAGLYDDLGHRDDASACYEQALARCRTRELEARVAIRLAALSKHVGRPERAVALWRRLIQDGQVGLVPYVELAKHYEHRTRDYPAAIAVVEQALARVRRPTGRQLGGEVLELEYRLARLLAKDRRRRLARAAEASAERPVLSPRAGRAALVGRTERPRSG